MLKIWFMKICKILSTRASNNKVYSDLVYEWEDDFSKELSIPIISYKTIKRKIITSVYLLIYYFHLSNFVQCIDFYLNRNKRKILVFTLYPSKIFQFTTSANKIPFLIDFDYFVDLNTFYKAYKNCQLVIVSSRVAFEYLKSMNCPLNIAHVPLSIKKDLRVERRSNQDKKYDIFVARQNKVLMRYLQEYVKKYPKTEYVVRKWEDDALYSCNAYYSNLKGRLGEFSDRLAYFNLLKECKVALYSTPGCDSDQDRFMNHVTPSLFEYIVSGCRIVARYKVNPDTIYFNFLEEFPNVQIYEEFELLLNKYLADNSDDVYEKSRKYLDEYGFKNQIKKFQEVISLIEK